MPLTRQDASASRSPSWPEALWIVLIVGASLGFSRAFACATPFAALGAVGALQLGRRDAVLAVLLAWFGNQLIGFGLLHYPTTWDSFAWGAAIGLAACAAALAASGIAAAARPEWARLAGAFTAAFVAYEVVLFAASFVLPSEGNAFALAIIARILAVNVVAFAALVVVHRLAIGLGLLLPPTRDGTAIA